MLGQELNARRGAVSKRDSRQDRQCRRGASCLEVVLERDRHLALNCSLKPPMDAPVTAMCLDGAELNDQIDGRSADGLED